MHVPSSLPSLGHGWQHQRECCEGTNREGFSSPAHDVVSTPATLFSTCQSTTIAGDGAVKAQDRAMSRMEKRDRLARRAWKGPA